MTEREALTLIMDQIRFAGVASMGLLEVKETIKDIDLFTVENNLNYRIDNEKDRVYFTSSVIRCIDCDD